MSSALALLAALSIGAPMQQPTAAAQQPAEAMPNEGQGATEGAPAASPPPPSPVPASTPDSRSNERTVGKALLGAGGGLMGVGVLSLIAVALPSAIVKRVALNRARRDPIIGVTSRDARYGRARVADDVMEGAFWTGVTTLAIGLPLLITGAVIHKNARSDIAKRLDLDASGVTVRF